VRDRGEKDLIFVEGLRLSEEALNSNLPIKEVFIAGNFRQNSKAENFLERVSERRIEVIEVSEKIFSSLADTKTSQGVVLISQKPATGKSVVENHIKETKPEFPLVILLQRINNPSNLGAVLRTAEAANVSGVILSENSVDAFSPKALRGAMGAAFRLPVWDDADFFEVLDWAKAKNLASVCADVNAEKSYLNIDWRKPRLLICGSEAHGLSERERKAVDESLIIPMENNVESLNLAVSCAVILFEARRQTRE
jgi:TrmH family RNA methyltransferase